jgi:hypothetical protein
MRAADVMTPDPVCISPDASTPLLKSWSAQRDAPDHIGCQELHNERDQIDGHRASSSLSLNCANEGTTRH